MKKKLKWIVIGLLAVVLVATLGGFIYFKYFFTIPIPLFEAGPTKEVNLAGWTKLEKGMTRQQVANLLGEASWKSGPGTIALDGAKATMPETWQYNWTAGLSFFGEVHPKAYVVWFGNTGKLVSWREPVETNGIEIPEARTTPRTVP